MKFSVLSNNALFSRFYMCLPIFINISLSLGDCHVCLLFLKNFVNNARISVSGGLGNELNSASYRIFNFPNGNWQAWALNCVCSSTFSHVQSAVNERRAA
jgi:hypothetical protein